MGKDKLIIIIVVLATVFILVAAVFLFSNSSGQNSSPSQTVRVSVNDLIGKSAPDFTLEDYNGAKMTLSSLKGKNVILFFSEGLMCYPACWDQIAAFAKDNDKFIEKNTVVLTIINDPKSDWKQALEKMPELKPANVLFDSDKQVARAYNTLSLPSSMHKGLLPGHTYFVVDKEGIVRFVKDDPAMATRNQEMMAEIEKLP